MSVSTTGEPHEFSPWPAFVDLLAATVLLLIAVIAVVSVTAGGGVTLWRDALLRSLSERPGYGSVFTIDTTDALALGIILEAETTFPRNRFEFQELTTHGKAALDEIAETLNTPSIREWIWEVRIVGHTDSLPYLDPRGAFSNWELSAARAAAIARYLVTRSNVDPCLVTAAGRGSHYPSGGGSTPRTPEADRRIEIQVIPEVGDPTRMIRPGGQGCDRVGDGTPSGTSSN